MKKTEAHALVMQALQDYVNRLASTDKAAAQITAGVLQQAMAALAPVPDTVVLGDPPGATNG